MKKILLFTAVLCVHFSFSQSPAVWQMDYGSSGDDYASAGSVTPDGGYTIIGQRYMGSNATDILVSKLNQNGQVSWSKAYGTVQFEAGYDIANCTDGGYILVGRAETIGTVYNDVYLTKVDANGTMQWSKTFGGPTEDVGKWVTQTPDGGFVVAGYTESIGTHNSDQLLFKVDGSGNLLWYKTYGSGAYDDGMWAQTMPDGGFVIVGATYGSGAGGEDVLVTRTDANGIMQWSRAIGGQGDDYAYGAKALATGEVIVTAHTNSFGAGGADILLFKVDIFGNVIWDKTYGGTSHDFGRSVTALSDGSIVVLGYSLSFGAGDWSNFMLKTDATGNLVWSKLYRTTPINHEMFVRTVPDGSIFVWASSSSGQFGNVAYCMKADANGNTGGCLSTDIPFTVTTPLVGQTSGGPEHIVNEVGVNYLTATTVCPTQTEQLCFTGIETSISANQISVYPNPVSDLLTVTLASSEENNSSVSLSDVSGRIIFSDENFLSGSEINCSSLSEGIYFISIQSGVERTTQKISVQH